MFTLSIQNITNESLAMTTTTLQLRENKNDNIQVDTTRWVMLVEWQFAYRYKQNARHLHIRIISVNDINAVNTYNSGIQSTESSVMSGVRFA